MKRKIIQISAESDTEHTYGRLWALCDDGTVWHYGANPEPVEGGGARMVKGWVQLEGEVPDNDETDPQQRQLSNPDGF